MSASPPVPDKPDGAGSLADASRSAIHWVGNSLSRILGGESTLADTGRWLTQQLWIWPVVAAVLMGGIGWWVHGSVEEAMREQRVETLTSQVESAVAAVRIWMDNQKVAAQLTARDEGLAPLTGELLKLESAGDPSRALLASSALEAMRARLAAPLAQGGYLGFILVSPEGVVLASEQNPPIGQKLDGYRAEFAKSVLAGGASVSLPFASTLSLKDEKGKVRPGLPTMYAAAPIVDAGGKPLAALGLRISPEKEFTRVLEVAQSGDSGETYAFDEDGLMLSQSRFDDELKQMGLLADSPDAASILTLEVRDPGVDMVAGERPAVRRSEQPLTKMAAAATKGEDGVDADGYRGYRGAYRVGAWRWLPEYKLGIATEINVAEAFAPVNILRRSFWALMILLGLAAVGIYAAMWYMASQQRAMQEATLAARQLGQYTLEEKIGEGGMGAVYRGRHAMLRRPTAVKLLDPKRMSPQAVARFEREVQFTSALTHPNTVAIFDYGRTPDGIFYYAMELLDGLNMEDLVGKHGVVSEARAIYLLRQACGALAEAHAAGLVHRDIKPGNIFLTTRGGMNDFVKVLDFGLVKAAESSEAANITSTGTVTGTPLYMSPEAIQQPDQVDARADVYAVGAVAYWLLTGTPVFRGDTVMEICLKHVRDMPEPIVVRSGRAISPDLETLIRRCLAKSPADRPADAGELVGLLAACQVEGIWTERDAGQWWREHTAGNTPPPTTSAFAVTGQTPAAATTDAGQLDATAAFEMDQKPFAQ